MSGIIENFESLALGDLTGQSDWIVSKGSGALVEVQPYNVHAGTKALYIYSPWPQAGYAIQQQGEVTSLHQSVYWMATGGAAVVGMSILEFYPSNFKVTPNHLGQVVFRYGSGVGYDYDVLLSSITSWQWYKVEIEMINSQARARVDGGAWTPWRNTGGVTVITSVVVGTGHSGPQAAYWDDFGIPAITVTSPVFEVPLFIQGFPSPLPVEPFNLNLSLLPEQIIQNIEAVPFNSTITLTGACTGPPPVFYEALPMPEGGDGAGATGGGGEGGIFSLGHGFIDATQRSQALDYGETMGKRKKPWAAKGYTFPEVQAFHQETFPVGVPGGPGGPGGPMSPAGDPCAGRVLQPLTHITVPCGDKDFPLHAYGAVGEVTIHWPEGITGNTTMGTIEGCPENESITFWVCDECPGCSTVTIWFDKCPCGSSGITCGADVPICGGTPCSQALPVTGATQFTSLAGGTWSLSPGGEGWSVDQTGKVTTVNVCGGQVLKVTGENCCISELNIRVKYNLSIDCSSPPCGEIVKSSSKTYSATGASGPVLWSVTGTGATISQSGTLTTDATACGMLEIQVTDECGGCGSMSVRVTNGGTWVLISTQYAAAPSGTYGQPSNYGCNGTNCQSCMGGGNGTWTGQCGCNVISGAYRTDYYTGGICLCQVSQAGYDIGYRNGVFPSAGSAPCTGGKPDNSCLGGCGCSENFFGGSPPTCSSTSYTFVTYRIETREWRCP